GGISLLDLGTLSDRQLPAGARTKSFVGFSSDGRWVVTRGRGKAELAAWPSNDSTIGAPVLLDGFQSPDRGTRAQDSLTFSPGGRWMLMPDINGATPTLWDFRSLNRFGTLLTGHTGGVRSATFAPDDEWLVTSSWDGTARLWFLKEGAD